ncbi:MAG: M23 family metallopeptidase [Mariprofundaceae bacterium]
MAIALRFLALVALLILSGCFKTELPYSRQYSKATSSKSHSIYQVRRGDTLYSIGKRFGMTHKLLAKRNHIRYPYTIFVGQRLHLARKAPKPQYLPLPKKKKKRVKKVSKKRKVGKRKKATKTKHRTARGVSSVRLQWPVKGTLTSKFGRRGSRMHDGIDVGAKEGTPIYAAAAGEVVYSDSRMSGYGKLIILRHSNDMFTAYAHNQRNLVRKGLKVKKGSVIARVGQTGRATGPHLHFEVRRGSTPVDPLVYLPKRR